MEATNLAEAEGLPTIEWPQVELQLADLLTHDDPRSPNRSTFWLTTLNADGSPHVTSVGALWHAGSCWFQTGERTRKAKNLDAIRARRSVSPRKASTSWLRAKPGVSPIRQSWPRLQRCGRTADGRRSPTTREPASPHRSTRRRSDHRRGSSTKSSHARRPLSAPPKRRRDQLVGGSERSALRSS